MYFIRVGCACVGGIELLITSNSYYFRQFLGYSLGFVKRVEWKIFGFWKMSKEKHEKRYYFGGVFFI